MQFITQVTLAVASATKLLSARCECEAGMGKCNHVIGLLYLLAHYQALGLKTVPPAISKTSLPQTWNVPNRSQGINPGEVQDVTIQRVKMPTTSTKRSDGIRSNLYNPIPNVIGDLAVVEKLRTAIKNFPSVQLHSALPASSDVCKVSCKFGDVPKGSMLSYQQRVKLSNKPKVHINIEAPDPSSFTLPPVNQTYSTVLTMSQQHFIGGLKLSLGQANLDEKETQNQADDKLWHELRAQRLTASKFKDVCCRKKDFELLAERFMKKTIQTAAMKYGIDNEENAATSYADITRLNVYPCGIIVNPSCPHLACSPDRRVYDPSEANPWGTLEIRCSLADSVVELPYLREVNGALKLKKTHTYYYQVNGPLLLSEITWVDFFVFCKNDYHLERIRSDSEMQTAMKEKLDQFYFEFLIQRLMKC